MAQPKTGISKSEEPPAIGKSTGVDYNKSDLIRQVTTSETQHDGDFTILPPPAAVEETNQKPEQETRTSEKAGIDSSRQGSFGSLSSFDDLDFNEPHSPTVPANRLGIADILDSFALSTKISQKISDSALLRRSKKISALARKQRDRVVRAAKDEDIKKLLQHFAKQVDKLDQRLNDVSIVPKREKISFAVTLYFILLTGILIASRPEWFHVYYTFQVTALMPLRIYSFRKRLYQYFLFDLCYFTNLLCLVYLWVFPKSVPLFISCYSLSFGTLSWAVVTWRNSLVLHSLDKVTSVTIHIFPPVTFHVIVHQLPTSYKEQRFPGASQVKNWDFLMGLIWSSIFYFIWQFLYHYFITIKRAEKIKQGRFTSFEWLRKSYAKTKLGKFVNGLPGFLPIVAFTFIQFGYQLSTMLLCPIWYNNIYCSFAFLSFIFLVASYNGATYYIDVFGRRLEKEVARLNLELDRISKAAAVAEANEEPLSMPSSAASSAASSLNNSPELMPLKPSLNGMNDSRE